MYKAGLITFGVCIQKRTHWIGPAMGEAISSFGLQTITTICYAYSTDVWFLVFVPCLSSNLMHFVVLQTAIRRSRWYSKLCSTNLLLHHRLLCHPPGRENWFRLVLVHFCLHQSFLLHPDIWTSDLGRGIEEIHPASKF